MLALYEYAIAINLYLQGMVEKWLLQVEDAMVSNVRRIIGEAVEAYTNTARNQWVLDWPGQIVICVSSIFWTAEVTEAMQAQHGVPVRIITSCFFSSVLHVAYLLHHLCYYVFVSVEVVLAGSCYTCVTPFYCYT